MTGVPSKYPLAPDRSPRQLRDSGRVLLSALGWLLIGTVIAPLIVALAARFGWTITHPEGVGEADKIALTLMSTTTTDCICLAAIACFQAARLSPGNIAAGLGNLPIRRRWLVLKLASVPFTFIVLLAFLVEFVPALQPVHRCSMFDTADEARAGWMIATMVMIAIPVPIAEELFFRGWLWVALRRFWSARRTGLVTGALFVALHYDGALSRPALIVPLAVALGLARHYCGSVRASIALHMTNNALVAVVRIAERFG